MCVRARSSFMHLGGHAPFLLFIVISRRVCRGAPSNEALPLHRRKTDLHWSAPAQGPGQRGAASFPVSDESDVVGHDPYPMRIISSCARFVCHSFGLAYVVPKSCLIFFFIIVIINIICMRLSLNKERVCVCVCVCVCTCVRGWGACRGGPSQCLV